jgi:hypothetical protein
MQRNNIAIAIICMVTDENCSFNNLSSFSNETETINANATVCPVSPLICNLVLSDSNRVNKFKIKF